MDEIATFICTERDADGQYQGGWMATTQPGSMWHLLTTSRVNSTHAGGCVTLVVTESESSHTRPTTRLRPPTVHLTLSTSSTTVFTSAVQTVKSHHTHVWRPDSDLPQCTWLSQPPAPLSSHQLYRQSESSHTHVWRPDSDLPQCTWLSQPPAPLSSHQLYRQSESSHTRLTTRLRPPTVHFWLSISSTTVFTSAVQVTL